jgi:hypothetical protein
MTGRFDMASEGRLRQGQRKRLYLAAGLMVCLLHFLAGPASAATLLDDFESGFPGLQGELRATGPVEATPRPGMVHGMRIAQAGEGACNNLIGDSRALCGADTKKWAGFDGAELRYTVDFGWFATLAFDLAAWSVRDPFDPWNGERSDEWGDYVRVQAWTGGRSTLLAEFTGGTDPKLRQGLVSTDAGALLGAGTVIDAQFRTILLGGLHRLFSGPGELVFQFRSTGSAEQMGLDNVRLLPPAPVPLPASLPLALLGLAMLGALGRMRRS